MSARAYWTLIERTGEGCYYLWGPIQNALLMEFAEGNKALIHSIALDGPLTKDRRMPVARKDMLFQVLTVAGEERRDDVSELLWEIIRRRSHWQAPVESRSLVEAKKLAALVAGHLQLSNVLLQLMLDREEELRRTAVRSAFYLWRDEKASAKRGEELLSIKILRELGSPRAVSRWVVPSRRLLQSCFELSLSMLFEDYGNQETTGILQEVWAGILGRILWQTSGAREGSQSFSGHAARLARSAVLRLAIGIALALAKNLQEERTSVYDIHELERFFRSSREVRERFRRLVPYIRPSAGSVEDIGNELKTLVTSRDLLSCYLLVLILVAHIRVHGQGTAAIIRELFEEAVAIEPGLPSIPMLIIALSAASDGKTADDIDAGILQLEEECIVRYQEQHGSVSQGQTGVRFVYSGLSSYPQYPYRKYGKVNRRVLNVFVDAARTDSGYDRRRIHNYVANVAVPGHPQYRDIGAILESLEPILGIALADVELEKDLIDALSRIQAYAPSKVDHFMNMQGIPREVQERVRNKSSEEEMASAVIGRGIFFVMDTILLQPDGQLSQLFLRWFERAPDCQNFAGWISLVIRLVLNALCKDKLFQL